MKNRKREIERSNSDKISSIPESIFVHIISLVDTKSAIRTSALSKHFRFLWTQLQELYFVLPSLHSLTYVRRGEPSNVLFEHFVNNVLQKRELSDLTSFRLSLGDTVSSKLLEDCVDYAVTHNVQNLRIRLFKISQSKLVNLPISLLNSSSLITLRLNNSVSNCRIELPKSISFPNLKCLRLKNFEFWDANSKGELFTGCPCLEDLVLNKCCIRVESLKLNCSNLKNLDMRYWRMPSRLRNRHVVIDVNSPGLVSFSLQGGIIQVNFKEGLPSLDSASLDARYPSLSHLFKQSIRAQMITRQCINVLLQLRHVKFLSLSQLNLEILSAKPELLGSPTMFENLRSIKFTVDGKYREVTIPIETVERSLNRVLKDCLVAYDISKEGRLRPVHLRNPGLRKSTNHYTTIYIPENVMRYLVKSSPSLQFITVEIPEVL